MARLIAWCAQHAWLYTVPRPAGAEDAPGLARAATLAADAPARALPDLGIDAPLVGWLAEAGWVQPVDGGAVGLSWGALRDWQCAREQPLSDWQLGALHRMSRAYAGAATEALDADCPPPQGAVHTPEALEARLETLLSGMARRPTP